MLAKICQENGIWLYFDKQTKERTSVIQFEFEENTPVVLDDNRFLKLMDSRREHLEFQVYMLCFICHWKPAIRRSSLAPWKKNARWQMVEPQTTNFSSIVEALHVMIDDLLPTNQDN